MTNIPSKKWARIRTEDKQKTNKHLRRCSTSLAIRQMEIKTTMRYHSTSTSMTWKVKKLLQVLVRMWRNLNPPVLLVGIWNNVPALENILPQKGKHRVSIWPSKLRVSIWPSKLRVSIWPGNSTPRFLPNRNENIYSPKNLSTNVLAIYS